MAGEWVGAGRVGPAIATIFSHLGASGRRTAAVFGDPELVGVCGVTAAHAHWPPAGTLPPDVELGPTGCVADVAIVHAAKDVAVQEAAFAMIQLDENDAVTTAASVVFPRWPWSAAATLLCRESAPPMDRPCGHPSIGSD